MKLLDEKEISIDSCKAEFDNLFSETGEFGSPFLGLETEHFQKKYFKAHFDLVVSCAVVTVSIYKQLCMNNRNLLAYVLGSAECGREEEPSEDVFLKMTILCTFQYYRLLKVY